MKETNHKDILYDSIHMKEPEQASLHIEKTN